MSPELCSGLGLLEKSGIEFPYVIVDEAAQVSHTHVHTCVCMWMCVWVRTVECEGPQCSSAARGVQCVCSVCMCVCVRVRSSSSDG